MPLFQGGAFMSTTIDYSTYSIEELYSAAEAIDREQFPERAAELDQLIVKREAENPELLEDEKAIGNKATRADRLYGAIIDAVVHILCTIPFFMWIGMENLEDPTLAVTLQMLAYGLTVTLVVQGYLLYYYSQTVGKHFMGTRIEHLDGTRADIKTILMRILPMSVIGIIPGVGQIITGLLNPIAIFGKEKRCLHDYIAKTKVCYTQAD